MIERTTEEIIELIDDAVSCIDAAKRVFLDGALRSATTSNMSGMVSNMREVVTKLERLSDELKRKSM